MQFNRADMARLWNLAPDVTQLNHGGFGTRPTAVTEAANAVRRELERNPTLFFLREYEPRLDRERETVSRLVHAPAAGIVFVENTTTGVNAVLQNFPLRPDDEILITSLGYAAYNNVTRVTADRTGAKVVRAQIPFPIKAPDEATDAIMAAVTPRTRLALIDHITSPTALVLPIREIVHGLKERGVETLVDGAHAPGAIPLDLAAIRPAFYTGNFHKWLCAPPGAAFLYVAEEWRDKVHPPILSYGADSTCTDKSRFLQEFDWVGTRDPAPWLCISAALEFLAGLHPEGLPGLAEDNRQLALEARRIIGDALNLPPAAPDSMTGPMVAFKLPDHPENGNLMDILYDREKIVVWGFPYPAPPQRVLRMSAQAFNTEEDYRKLARILPKYI